MSMLEFRRRTCMRVIKRNTPAAALSLTILLATACSKAPGEMKFATPEAAATTLLEAYKNNDTSKLEAMFGRAVMQEIASGDPTSDRRDRELIALAMKQSSRWVPVGADRSELIIGDEEWPFPGSARQNRV